MLSFMLSTKHAHHPYTVLSPSSVFTFFICALILLALLLVLAGLASIALGPILLMMGWSLLKFAAGMLLLLFLARIAWLLGRSLYRVARRLPFATAIAAQIRPWLALGLALARAFWRWYKAQHKGQTR